MKKLISVVLAGALALSLAACGGTPASTPASAPASEGAGTSASAAAESKQYIFSVDDPLATVVMGTGIALDNMRTMREVCID